MGADLYIKKIPDSYDSFMHDGYYRDSYNPYNLLWQFELSYWEDVAKRYCKDGDLTITGAQTWLKEMKDKEDIFERNLDALVNKKNKVWDYKSDGTYEPDKDLTPKKRLELVLWYQNKYKELKAFLNEAIKLNSEVECSL